MKYSMSKELSTELITHKLVIKWIWNRYITKKFAKTIYEQLTEDKYKTVKIINPKTLTFIEKYKNEVELYPLDDEEKSIEDKIALSWLSNSKKEQLRLKIIDRKQNNLPITSWILDNIIEKIKNS